MAKVTQKVLDNQYKGPDVHVSLDQTTHENPVPDYAPKGEAGEYPRWLYRKDGHSRIVNSREEHDEAGDGYDVVPVAPSDESVVPFGVDEKDLEGKSRSDLAEFGNLNYGLDLKGTQSREDLLAAIKSAAEAKNNAATEAAEQAPVVEG